MSADSGSIVLNTYYRGQGCDRERCFEVSVDVFGRFVRAIVVDDVTMYVENPQHTVLMTDVEWQEWRERAIRAVREYKARGR
jgi:hypothetical protein